MHTGGEYSEFLTRGLNGEKKVVNKQYPWMYMRIFAMLFVLFAVFLLIIRFTNNELFAPTVLFLSSIVFNLPFMVLIYELYPERDLSIMSVFAALLVGGTCADVLTQVLYSVFPAPDEWMLAVYAGFFEELSKSAVTIVIIVILGKRNPLVGFVMGAAVGCGFSIVEDFGYAFIYSNELPFTNLTTLIEFFISRGGTTFCTHILWTASVGWAYSYFDRHFSNVCYYFMLIVSCGLHICWDLPLEGFLSYLTITLCVIVVAVENIAILCCSRKKIITNLTTDQTIGVNENITSNELNLEQEELEFEFETSNVESTSVSTINLKGELVEEAVGGKSRKKLKRTSAYYTHCGHLALTIAAFVMSLMAIIYCSMPFRETYYSQEFDTSDEFVAFMQEDLDIKVNSGRVFDKYLSDEYNTVISVDGVLDKVTQKVVEGGYTYYYDYNVVESEGISYYYYTDVAVEIVKDGAYIKYYAEDIYNNGILYASFFRIRSDVTGYNFSSDGKITAFVYDASFEIDLSQPQYYILFYTFGCIAGVAIIIFAVYKIIARRAKKDEQ